MKLDKLFENFENVEKPLECERNGDAPPSWLSGSLLRNGPGLFKAGDTEVKHWFDGSAYIQRYYFKDGQLFYSARFLESNAYKKVKKANRLVVSEFGTSGYSDPCQSIYGRLTSFFTKEEITDNCLVNFSQIGDGVYALTEVPRMIQIDVDTLEAQPTVELAKYVTVHSASAHHHGDYEGNAYNIGQEYGKNYVFIKFENPKHIEGADPCSIECASVVGRAPYLDRWNPGYQHSFGMSENFFLLFESPVRLSLRSLMFRNLLSYSFQDCLYWKEGVDTNVIVVDKRTGKPHTIRYTAPPFFSFHFANTFEQDGFLVVDFCHMKNPGNFRDFDLEHMKTGAFQKGHEGIRPYLHRMLIPLEIHEDAKPGDDLAGHSTLAKGARAILQTNGIVHCESVQICNVSFEFPRYNYEHYNMRPYKYVYGSTVLFEEQEGSLTGIVKVNTVTGECISWNREHGEQLCAEPVFVPDPDGKEEDDGVLLVPVMTVKEGDGPIFLVLKARDLSEICRYAIPVERIPAGFHAMFFNK